MAKGVNQKLKMLYLVKILMTETDEDHGITLQEITDLLNEAGVNADRKTLYMDIAELRNYGLDIIMEQRNRTFYYSLVSRDFQLAELKLLVESVQAAKFITEKKSQDLIKKLETLASKHEAGQLERQLLIHGRVKSMNESIYYSVDKIHAAINNNKQITFQYFQWSIKKRMELRHGGRPYKISPLALLLDNENYYLVGYDAEQGIVKHYRVDKMRNLELTADRRQGTRIMSKKELSEYTNHVFGMFGGQQLRVVIEAPNSMVGIFLDRLGHNVQVIPRSDTCFHLVANIAVSQQFLGWIIALGPEVKIISPNEVVERMKETAAWLAKLYIQ